MPVFIGILFSLLLLFPTNGYPANDQEQILLTSIDVSSDTNQEQLILIFKSDYTGIPSINFDQGLVWVELPYSDFSPKLSYQSINNRFIQALRLGKEGKSTILEIQFADPNFEAVGLINYQIENDLLFLTIGKKKKDSTEEPEKSTLTQAIEQAERSQNSPFLANDYMADSSITTNIIKMLLALFLILIFFYLVLWVYNRYFVSKFSFKKGDYNIKVSASYHLGPKQKILVIEVNDAAYVCGVTSQNISVMSKVTDNAFVDFLSNYAPSRGKNADFYDLRAQYLASKKNQQQKQSSTEKEEKPKESFASELVNRVKKLRPID